MTTNEVVASSCEVARRIFSLEIYKAVLSISFALMQFADDNSSKLQSSSAATFDAKSAPERVEEGNSRKLQAVNTDDQVSQPSKGAEGQATAARSIDSNGIENRSADCDGQAGAQHRPVENHEGGIKRSFAKFGGSDLPSSPSSLRRAFVAAADTPTRSRESPETAANGSLFTEQTGGDGGPSAANNTRKREAASTAWNSDDSLAHKQRFSTNLPEEGERLRLMQLSDRQSSHAQAGSTSTPADSAKKPHLISSSLQITAPQPVSFKKASSPDIPEPPHKKGSGQANRPPAKKPDSPLRRKQPNDSSRTESQPVTEKLATTFNSSAAFGLSKNGHSSPKSNRLIGNSALDEWPEKSRHESAQPVVKAFLNSEVLDATSRKILEKLVLEDRVQSDSERSKDLASQLKFGRLLGQRGKVQAALNLANQLNLQHPNNADVLCLRGDCYAAHNSRAQAFVSFSAALNIDSKHLDSLLACGNLYMGCNLLTEAVDMFRRALEVCPDREDIKSRYAASLTDCGTKVKLEGNADHAITLYKEAIMICPEYGPAFYNLGVAYSEAQEVEKAMEQYGLAVEAQPSHAEAHCNMGVIHKNAGRLDEAIASYERSLAAAPNFEIVKCNLAVALTEKGTQVKERGDAEKGIELYERALVLNPKHMEALYNLAVVLGETRQLRRAVLTYEMAVLLRPDCAEAHNNLGVIHRELGNMERAMQCYSAALQIRPTFPQALNNVAVVLTAQGKSQDAHNLLMAAISAAPTYAEAYNNLGVLQRDVGSVKEAIASYEKCLELQPEARNSSQNRLLALNYINPGESAMVCGEHEKWGMEFQSQFERLPARELQSEDLERQLIIGYMSPDFFTHSVSYFAEAPLRHHNSQRMKVIAYNCSPTKDSKTELLKTAVEDGGGCWTDVASMSEQELAARVQEDKVDILVELTGHTANNRLGVVAQRPAPVQVTWIGYPNSTGLAAVDYRFTDEVCDPIETQQTFVEELIRLPGCFLCYTPPIDAPSVAPLPALELGFITFGSFNALAKITREVLALWAQVLDAVPNSRLLLKNKPFACEHARQHYLSQMKEEGICADRVDLLPLTAGNREHLETYSQMDISLDPWPYAGTTTTCESLFMGVPVVSLAGSCHAHNVGASLLTSVGLEGAWLAQSTDEYVAVAVEASRDLQKLADTRASLRERMLESPVCDGPGFVEGLEQVYRDLWHRRVRGSSENSC